MLTIRVQRDRQYAIVVAAGEIDIATAGQLSEPLLALAEDGCPLVADLDQVSFIDAAGLGVLAGAARRAAAHGAGLHVVCAQVRTRRLFALTGLDGQIPLARTLDEALQALTVRNTTEGGAARPAPRGRPARLIPAWRRGRTLPAAAVITTTGERSSAPGQLALGEPTGDPRCAPTTLPSLNGWGGGR
jgi:anti-sigma B factor antagonist